MNSSEFMLNNQVYTQKKKHKNENSNEKHSSIFDPRKKPTILYL